MRIAWGLGEGAQNQSPQQADEPKNAHAFKIRACLWWLSVTYTAASAALSGGEQYISARHPAH